MNGRPPAPEQVLSALLGEKAATAASGLLTATRGKHKRIFCFVRGRVVHAVSNVVEEQFSEELLRTEVISPSDWAAARQEAERSGRKPGAVLQDGFVDPSLLSAAMTRHVRSLLHSCLEWPDGEFTFSGGKPNLDGEILGDLSTVRVVLEHVRRRPARIEDVLVRIGPPDTRPAVTKAAGRILEGEDSDPACRYVLDHASGDTAVGDLAENAADQKDAVIRTVYGLLLLRAVERAGELVGDDGVAIPAVTRDEALGWLAKAEGGDYYGVLGLDRSAKQDDIRTAYYSLARGMHPDRFRTGEKRDLFDRVERFFTRVTEAYNTLFDDERRKEYDKLAATEAVRREEAARAQDTGFLAQQNFLRGKALLEKRRFSDAVSFLENAIKLDDSQAKFHLELGRVLAMNPRHRARAEASLLRASELDPSLPEIYSTLGDLYLRAGEKEEAARMFRESLRWEPFFDEAARRLKEMGASPKAEGEARGTRRLFGV